MRKNWGMKVSELNLWKTNGLVDTKGSKRSITDGIKINTNRTGVEREDETCSEE